MTLWQTSLTYRVWVWLCNVYEDSALHRILAAVGRWCSEQIEDSRVLRPLCREGAVARAWRESLLCRLLSVLVNLPGTLLHAWYKAWNLTFEDSFFARLAFDMEMCIRDSAGHLPPTAARSNRTRRDNVWQNPT